MKRLRRLRHGDRQAGASAVEFALIAPLLLVLVFGVIDYGLWFSDSLSTRQGVREAARQGVVANFDDAPSCTLNGSTGDANTNAIMCTAKDRIGGITGDASIKVVTPGGWVRGEPLIVCAQIPVSVGTGIVPLPNDRTVRSQVEMSIEKAEPGVVVGGGEETAPSGRDWNWCS